MADVLENVLTGRVLLEDFKIWLIEDSVQNCDERSVFINYFLNFVKGKCAWIISKDGKGLESPLKKEQRNNVRCNGNETLSPECMVSPPVDQFSGCSQTCDNEKVFFRNNKKSRGGENYSKSQYSAKKGLQFNNQDNKKANAHTKSLFDADIKSLEAFPPLDGKPSVIKSHEPKVRRRITPTPVQVFNKNSIKFGTVKFVPATEKAPNDVFKKTPFVENPTSNLQSEREMLKIKRNKLSQSTVIPNGSGDLKIGNNASPVKSSPVQYITPDPTKVSRKSQLEVYSAIYNVLIENALVPNVTSELYFIFELLTVRVSSNDMSSDKDNVFCSIHNCTFFGVTVLSYLQNFLALLDKNTMLSLSEIPFLSKFSSKLVNFLQALCKSNEVCTKLQGQISIPNRVPFLLEEDSKENFTDNQTFSSFRKQRDLFDKLLRDWQHLTPQNTDAKFQESFYRDARRVINIGPSTINMHHLAKLFQNQMLASCLGLEVNEVYDELLNDIQKNFPGKFEKLHQRFMMPFCVGEPNPPPSFYGIQSFFSEFINGAASVTFNQQLQDILVCKILYFNNADVLTDDELSSLDVVKEKYIFLLHTLRLLGKFLGYLYFLPYKVSDPLSSVIVTNQLSYRKYSMPPLDVLKLLKTAVETNRVILTVPWIVEYLSMIDSVAKNLPYIEDTLKILAAIYRGHYTFPSNSLNAWFLRIIIGWLFDVLNYPFEYSCLVKPVPLENESKIKQIDSLLIIDKQLVHSCCPYLIEFKVLVHSFINGIKNHKKREVRKITPLSTTKREATPSLTKQQTEMQLEQNFFFLHPPSLKKTVEFVSERMASKVINRIRSEVTELKLYSIKYITDQEAYKKLLDSKPANGVTLNSFVDTCILELYKKSQSKISDFINVKCSQDVEQIIPGLLSDDVKPPVLKMCCKISFRHALDKIVDWCDKNLILLDIQKDIKNKLNHLSKEGEIMLDGSICVSSSVSTLRRIAVDIQSFQCDIVNVLKIVSDIPLLLDKDIGFSAKKLLFCLTVDVYISLLTHCPEKCDDECNAQFINVWSLCPGLYDFESYFLGVQNIKLIICAQNFESSSDKFIKMLSNLSKNDSFDADKFKDCLTKLASLRWQDSKAKNLVCLTHALSNILSPVNEDH